MQFFENNDKFYDYYIIQSHCDKINILFFESKNKHSLYIKNKKYMLKINFAPKLYNPSIGHQF